MQATQVQIVLSSHVNGIGRLFGGQLMSWIDVTGAVAARRFCKSEVVTLTVDRLQFFKGVRMNQTLELDARVTWAGRTSMEVRVDTYVDPLTGERGWSTGRIWCAWRWTDTATRWQFPPSCPRPRRKSRSMRRPSSGGLCASPKLGDEKGGLEADRWAGRGG